MIDKLETAVFNSSDKRIKKSKARLENQEQLNYSRQVSDRILKTLKERKRSQKYLAGILEVSPQTVNKWVKGSENFTLGTIQKIEKALEIKLIQICKD